MEAADSTHVTTCNSIVKCDVDIGEAIYGATMKIKIITPPVRYYPVFPCLKNKMSKVNQHKNRNPSNLASEPLSVSGPFYFYVRCYGINFVSIKTYQFGFYHGMIKYGINSLTQILLRNGFQKN